ncbi:hypothetical protein [Paracoccus yeei]|uniref:hypothetical protein n=1 Tax=Paracoccus yeei TaxID=147645 RepID=UPI0035B4F390
MAAQAIGSLFVSLGLDSAAFTAGIKQAQGKVAQFAANLNKRLGALGNLPGIGKLQAGLTAMSAGVAAAAGAASAAAVVALSAMSVSAINTAAEIKNLSQLANATPEEFQKMAYAAEQVGISQEKFSDILKDVNDRVGDFIATGGGPMKDFFERIAPQVGVTAQQFRKLSGPQALQLYVSSLEKANVNQQDFTFFMEAMASDSTALLPILRNSGKLANEYADRLVALGGVMSNDTVAKLASMKTALREVGVVMTGLKNSLGAAFAPIVEALARGFVSLFEAGAPLRVLFDGIARVVSWLASVVGSVITIIAAVVRGIWDVVSAGAAWLNSTTGVGSALKMLWDNTIGGVGRVLVWFADLIKATGGIGGAFSALGDLAGLVWQGIGDSAAAIPPALWAVWDLVKADFLKLVLSLQQIWANFLDTFQSGIIAMGGFSDAIFDATSAAQTAMGETQDSIAALQASAGQNAARAGQIMSDAFAPARDRLAELTKTTQEAAASLSGAGGAGGEGLSQAMDGAGKKAKEAKEKLTPLQEVMKRLKEEAKKLQATLGMTDLDAKIWEDQTEAGVSASSQAGKSIAALNTQIDTLTKIKDATKRGKEAFNEFFSSILDGVDSAKAALANLLMQIAKVQFAKAALGLLGSTSWGAKLISGVGGLLGENANGTSNWRGGLTKINERGGEIVDLPSGTRIIPHDVSKRMVEDTGTSGGGHVSIGFDRSTGSLTATMYDVAGNVVAQASPSIEQGAVKRAVRMNRKSSRYFGK